MDKRHLLLMFIIFLITQGCKKHSHEELEYTGVAICASDNFLYLEDFRVNGNTTPAAADFTVTPYAVNLTAGLSEEVSWNIKIQGETSGAIKTFSGVSKTVNVNWYGNADADIFFIDGENCKISFQPACKEAVSVDLLITHKSTFANYGFLLFDYDHVSGY